MSPFVLACGCGLNEFGEGGYDVKMSGENRRAILGAHMSIAGGFDKAVQRARLAGCDCVQIFTKNNHQWRTRAMGEREACEFRTALAVEQICHPIAHASYLINLASPDRTLWKRSVDAMVVELHRGDQLGLSYVIVHPGAHTTASERTGIRNVIRAVNEIHRQTKQLRCQCLLETTAGQGTSLGWRFEQLAAILGGVRDPDRLAVCFDTCHVWAAGYALNDVKAYRQTLLTFDGLVGLGKIKAIHLNDSQRERGSRVDRHAHIGRGQLGLMAFELVLNDRRLRGIPMYLETPKGVRRGIDWDVVNLRTLRALERSRRRERPAGGAS